MERPSSYLDLLPPEVGARVNRMLKEQRFFALFPELPPEMQLYVLVQVRYPDLMRFCATSRAARDICDDEYFWELKTHRDFGVEYDKPPAPRTSWKEDYQYYFQETSKRLIEAASDGNVVEMKELLDFGINPNVQDDSGWSALMMASGYGGIETVKVLLEAGALVNLQSGMLSSPTNTTALILATFEGGEGRTDIVKILLEAGADPNHRDGEGWSPLDQASIYGDTETVRVLLEAGALVNLHNDDGVTALMRASEEGEGERYVETVEILLEGGANPNIKDKEGETALMKASKSGHTEIVRMLLKNGDTS